MANKRLPQKNDKVKIVNCRAAKQYTDRIFEVTGCPYIMDRRVVASLKGLHGYFEVKNLEIID